MSEDTTKNTPEKKRIRSPAYPTTSLEDSVAKAKIVWDKDGQSETSLAALAVHWEYNPKSSSTAQMAAALKKFGLLEDVDGKMGKLRLTKEAIRFFSDEEPDSEAKIAFLKKAALSPSIYSDLWQKYKGIVPSDAAMKSYLVPDLNFNKDIVDKLIRDFRATITFAKLSTNDSMVKEQDGTNENDLEKPLFQQRHVIDSLKEAPIGFEQFRAPAPVMKEFSFPLPTGVATLKLPVPLTPEGFENLIATMNSFKDGLVKKPEPFLIDSTQPDYRDQAQAAAELGVEFNLTGFSFSHHATFVKELAKDNSLDLKIDLGKKLAMFKKLPA